MCELPYEKLSDGRASVDAPTLVNCFDEAELQWELVNEERFCLLAHGDVTWTVFNRRLSTVTCDEKGGGIRITRIIDRPLSAGELVIFGEVLDRYGCP